MIAQSLDVAIRSAREQGEAIDAAAQRKDDDLAGHAFAVLGVLVRRADQLAAEANRA